MNKKKKILLIASSLVGLLFVTATAAIVPIVLNEKKSSPINTNNKKNNFDQVKTDIVTSLGFSEREVLDEKDRNVQTKYYEPELWKQYHKDYGFIYPGYNRNYEQGNNRYFTNANGDQIDAKELVFNERLPDGRKYNDPSWIKEEIAAGTFKKHPAADNFYQNDISKIKSQTTAFTASTVVTGEYVTGLYAPPGEVVTLKFDDPTWNQIVSSNWTGLEIVINENFWDNRASNDSGGISNRYPFLESIFRIDTINQSIQFGSPFGGGISLWIQSHLTNNSSFPVNPSNGSLSFTISGAIPCMYYQDGVTTKEEWEQQKQKVIDQQLAPIIQAMGPYHSLTLPFTGLNQAGWTDVKKLIYPNETFKKWNDFLYLSNYYASRDLNNNISRLNMEFCDDIWGGAGAWGGGMNFYCPTSWGVTAFFSSKPIEVFNSGSSWGVFHEINHNFEQNSAIFKKNTHGETNQVTAFNLSVISDAGRLRSDINYSGERNKDNHNLGWSRLNNPFVTIYDVVRNKKADEYPIYSILLFMFGSKWYSDYLRWDVVNHPNTMDGWNGFDEIKTMSEFFKLDLWPAFFDYGKYWNDTWPVSTSEITLEQQQVIEELNSKYPAADFVANHYASGNYVYDSQNKQFVYGGDVISPFEIIAGQPYVFDLNKFVISTNINFNWSNLKFNPTTKNGGALTYDSESKKLTYIPPNNVNDVDEFDISIIPGDWANKPKNYVPEYKFKIKVRQVINEPHLTLYQDFRQPNLPLSNLFDSMIKKELPIYYQQPMVDFETNQFTDKTKKQGIKVDFNFIAPQSGNYIFRSKYDDAVRMFVNDKLEFSDDVWKNNFNEVYSKHLNKGDILHFEFYVINTNGIGKFDFETIVDGNSVDQMDYMLSPNYANYVGKQTPYQAVTNKDYHFKTRTIDKHVFTSDLTSSANLSDYQQPIIEADPSNYILTSKYGKNVKNLNDYGTNYLELWNSDHAPGQAASEFETIFKTPEKIASLYFGHRTNNHPNARATNIKVTGYSSNDDKDGTVLYDGEYGEQFSDRGRPYSILNLDKPMIVKKIKIEAYNTKQDGLIWQWFRMSPIKYHKIKGSIPVNYDQLNYSGGWEFKNNDDENTSPINNIYTKSTSGGDTLEFNLKNSNGFNIIGKSTSKPTKINVYVNGKKINNSPVIISSNKTIYNHLLYLYSLDAPQDLNVKIEHLDNNPLYLDFIMKF